MRKRDNWRLTPRRWVHALRLYVTRRFTSLTSRQRAMILSAAALLIACLGILGYQLIEAQRYQLDDKTLSIIGSVNKNLAAKLTHDKPSAQWRFNASSLSTHSEEPFTSLKSQVGGGGARDNTLYATTFAKDPSQGVTFHDTQTQLAFTMTPKFSIKTGKSVDGRLIYPMQKGAKLIYTPKNNGMKEDIVLPRYINDELSYQYKLSLPKTLNAKIQDDGSVGIFSANPMLFGEVKTSEESDAEKLRSAREDAEKTHLLFAIPAPVIIQSGDRQTNASARFGLDGDTLTVTARGMDSVQYPASIDPSVVVTSSSDFAVQGNSVDNIALSSTDQIQRSTLKTSSFNPVFLSTTGLPASSVGLDAVLYNGTMYALGGSGFGTNVYYSSVASNGTLGSWESTAPINTGRSYANAGAYNGYLYVWGGYNTANNTVTSSVEYAKINTDGSLGPWQTSTSMLTGACRAGGTIYNGYIYSLGGSTTPDADCTSSSSGAINTAQYAPLNPDGSVGTWQTTNSISYGSSGAVISPMVGAYNGYMYIAGGHNNGGGTAYTNVQYASIADDGAISNWQATTDLPQATHSAGFSVQEGYITTFSNQANSSFQNSAQVFANGRIGTWYQTNYTLSSGRSDGALVMSPSYAYYIGGTGPSSAVDYSGRIEAGRLRSTNVVTSSFTTTRERMGAVAHKGCMIVAGGYGSVANTYVNYAQSSPLDGNGDVTTSWLNRGFSTARADLAVTAYNGYVYIAGGYNGTTYYSDVQYAAINDDCTLGSWATTTAFDSGANARGGISAEAYNGYLYVTGGKRDTTDYNNVRYAPINDDGTVGSWSDTTALPSGLNRHRIVISGNRIYLLGGTQVALPNPNNGATTGSRPTGTGSTKVYVATINENGTLGSWQETTNLPIDLYEFGATVSGGYLYVAGGYTSTGSGVSTNYYFAPITADGTVGTWKVALNREIGFASVSLAAYNGYLYVAYGRTDANIVSTGRSSALLYAQILNAGGGQATSPTSGNALATGRTHTATATYNGHIYTAGGSDDGGATPLNSVERAGISSQNGSPGSFTTDSHALSTAVMSPASTAYNGYLYVVGGKTSSGYQGAVQYAPIGSSGALSGNFSTTTDFTTSASSDTGREGVCVATHNGYMYSVGGWDGNSYYNDVRYASISNNGSLSAWSSAGATFATARSGAGCLVAGGRLYVFGGKTASTVRKDVQYATINPNGTLGSWQVAGSFPGGRTNFISGYSNGFLYIYGGCTTNACSAGRNNLLYAQVNIDGTLEAWHAQAMSNSPYLSSGSIHKGYLYQIGGSGVTGGASATNYSPLAAIGRTARYSKLIDLGAEANINSIDVNGIVPMSSVAPGTSRVTFRSALTGNEWRAGSTAASAISQSSLTCDSSSPTFARYVLVSVTLDDTLAAGFPDLVSTPARVTDITVDYTPAHPLPNQRLAHGKSFRGEQLQPLDTCG